MNTEHLRTPEAVRLAPLSYFRRSSKCYGYGFEGGPKGESKRGATATFSRVVFGENLQRGKFTVFERLILMKV